MTEKELIELKKRIDSARTKKAELTGRRDYLLKELNENWGCTSVQKAEEKAEELEIQVKDLQQKITTGLAGIETQLERPVGDPKTIGRSKYKPNLEEPDWPPIIHEKRD